MTTVLVVVAVLVICALVSGAIVIASNRSSSLTEQATPQMIRFSPARQVDPAPATLQRLGGGRPVVVGGAVGSPRVVNFFASWCPACKKELAALASVARSSPISFLGVDTDDSSPGEALALLKKAKATYPVGVGTASLAERYGASGLPTTAFVDKRGRVVALALGAVTRSELLGWVRDLEEGRPLSS